MRFFNTNIETFLSVNKDSASPGVILGITCLRGLIIVYSSGRKTHKKKSLLYSLRNRNSLYLKMILCFKDYTHSSNERVWYSYKQQRGQMHPLQNQTYCNENVDKLQNGSPDKCTRNIQYSSTASICIVQDPKHTVF